MQHCRRSQSDPDLGWSQTPRAPQPRKQSKKLAPGACIQQAFEGRMCEWKGAIKQAMTGGAYTVRLSAMSLFYRLQQRLYNCLAAQDGYREKSEKIVPWKRAQFLEVLHRKWRHTYALTCSSFPLTCWPCLLSGRCHRCCSDSSSSSLHCFPSSSFCSGNIPVSVLQAIVAYRKKRNKTLSPSHPVLMEGFWFRDRLQGLGFAWHKVVN